MVFVLAVGFLHTIAAAATASAADLAILPCAAMAPAPALPATVSVPHDLQRHITAMLSLSATFRAQCRRIAEAPGLRVLIRIDPGLGDRGYRARTLIHRTAAGSLLALVQVSVRVDPVEWIAHEIEHIVEQLEGVRLSELAAVNRGAWLSAENMFETRRAIEAGRAVVGEMTRARRSREGDKFVE
jgi:hypothetical protein